MTMSKKAKQGIVLAVIVILVGGAYFYFQGSNSDTQSLLESVDGGSEASQAEARLLGLLSDLREIDLDQSLFESEAFTSREDFSIELPDEPIGRNNPFLPIGQDEPFITGEEDGQETMTSEPGDQETTDSESEQSDETQDSEFNQN